MSEPERTNTIASVKLRDDVTVEKTRKGRITLTGWGRRLPGVPENLLIERLAKDWLTEAEIDGMAESAADPAQFYYLCAKLFRFGFLQVRCAVDGRPLFSLIPAPDWSEWQGEPAGALKLSPNANIRREGNDLLLEVPLSPEKCLIHDGECLAWLMEIVKGDSLPSMEDAGFRAFHRALELAGAIVRAGDEAPAVWEPHDLMFFHHSSLGFHDEPIGATWRLKEKLPPQPLFKPVTGQCIPLPEPDPLLTGKLSAPFFRVLTHRRSGRVPGDRPITLPELGVLLHVSARVQSIRDDPDLPCPVSFRPSPSGGALHSLEIYPLVHNCDGLARGAWRYDPAEHRLESVPANHRLLDGYLKANPHVLTGGAGLPHIRLVITSRFPREAWKYEKIAYRLVLQDLGCLYQTLSLAAGALGLASCILGTVDAKTLGAILGLEPLTEPAIGEMTLSSR